MRLSEVCKEISHLEKEPRAKPTNSLMLGVSDLKRGASGREKQSQRQQARKQELENLLAWAQGEIEAPEQKAVAELDLTREAILTQMKLDIFTAQETLIDEFIEIGLKPVFREEARVSPPRIRRMLNRSTAKGKEGQLLETDVEKLYQSG